MRRSYPDVTLRLYIPNRGTPGAEAFSIRLGLGCGSHAFFLCLYTVLGVYPRSVFFYYCYYYNYY